MAAEASFPRTSLSEAERKQVLERFVLLRPAEDGSDVSNTVRTGAADSPEHTTTVDQTVFRKGVSCTCQHSMRQVFANYL
jgi:hypothetical protein